MGKDTDHPPVAFSTVADQATSLSDALWALFKMLRETLVYLGPAIRWEQDPTLSKFMSHSQDLPLGALLYTILPTSVLRQCIQILCCLDTELDFAMDFRLLSPVASGQPLRLPDSRWELGTSI